MKQIKNCICPCSKFTSQASRIEIMSFVLPFSEKSNPAASLHWLIHQTDQFLFLEWARAEYHLSESDREVKNSYQMSSKTYGEG